jgi:hypothetical protein
MRAPDAVPEGGHTVLLADKTFAGHEVCGDSGEWIRGEGVASAWESGRQDDFHPNEDGQAGYALALRAFIETHVGAAPVLTAAGLPPNPSPVP